MNSVVAPQEVMKKLQSAKKAMVKGWASKLVRELGLSRYQNLAALRNNIQQFAERFAEDIVEGLGLARLEGVADGDPGSVPILKGVAKRYGDGFKDQTYEGEVIFVMNQELTDPPFAPGQYPRVKTPGWTASTDMFTFIPMTKDDLHDFQAYMKGSKDLHVSILHVKQVSDVVYEVTYCHIDDNYKRSRTMPVICTTEESIPVEGQGYFVDNWFVATRFDRKSQAKG